MEEEKEEKNNEFDFSIYEDDNEQKEQNIESLKDLEAPRISGLRSRFSLGQSQLEKLADLGFEMSKYAIKVRRNTQDMGELKDFFAIVDEIWDEIRDIFGESINKEMLIRRKKCKKLLSKYSDGHIPEMVHNNLLKFKRDVKKLMQYVNLGIETERTSRGIYSKAQRGIIQ